MHPPFFNILLEDAGWDFNSSTGRIGRCTKLPPQFGQIPFKISVAHVIQNVHSNEQITASVDSGGKSLLQHSQLGLSSNI